MAVFTDKFRAQTVFGISDADRETIPYQITAPCLLGVATSTKAAKVATKSDSRRKKEVLQSLGQAEGAGDALQIELRFTFVEHIPKRPWCSNEKGPVYIRPRELALKHRYIQFNGPSSYEWMPFDVDRAGGYYAASDANLPPANVTTVNRENGHAHLAYLLAKPVAKHSLARLEPLRYFASVQRGFTKRLDADRHYVGLIAQNPAHQDWLVEWRRNDPYTLDELNDWLFDTDKRFDPHPETPFGAGRNVTTFDELRTFAYREVLRFKRQGKVLDAFRSRLQDVALGINSQFVTPLPFSEIRATVKSVAKWTWARFSLERFSDIQRARINMRWINHEAENTTQPWLALGISRATYYRRKAAGELQ